MYRDFRFTTGGQGATKNFAERPGNLRLLGLECLLYYDLASKKTPRHERAQMKQKKKELPLKE
jgi:hypothetical protein